MKEFLQVTDVINWNNTAVLGKAGELALDCESDEHIAKKCFEFVRDEIRHSSDFCVNPVTCRASDVLLHRTGYCYAKAHLLAALLRANEIPAGLCYQRLTIDGEKAPYCLHGLNAIYLEPYGWFRVDPRGNKPGVDAQFCPPNEQLAFTTDLKGEADFPEICADPLPIVIDTLKKYTDYLQVLNNLPDIPVIKI